MKCYIDIDISVVDTVPSPYIRAVLQGGYVNGL